MKWFWKYFFTNDLFFFWIFCLISCCNFLIGFGRGFFFCPPYPLKIVPSADSLCGIKIKCLYHFLLPLLLKPDQHYVANFRFCFLAETEWLGTAKLYGNLGQLPLKNWGIHIFSKCTHLADLPDSWVLFCPLLVRSSFVVFCF